MKHTVDCKLDPNDISEMVVHEDTEISAGGFRIYVESKNRQIMWPDPVATSTGFASFLVVSSRRPQELHTQINQMKSEASPHL